MKLKIRWVDNLKSVGILAVILGHIASPFGTFIFSWHMPLFFIIAGFFLKFDLNLKNFIKNDFRRLMIPYFLFSIVGIIVETLKRIALNRESLDYMHELRGVFVWMDGSSLMNSYAFVLWFLPALFLARVILVVFNLYIENMLIKLVLIFGLFGLSFLIELPFAIDNALNAILFVFIGKTFFKYYQDYTILYVFPIIAILIYFIFGIPILDMASKNYENIFINTLFAIGVIYLIIHILKEVDYTNNLISTWGRETMLLFILHPYTNNIAHIVVEYLHWGGWYLKFAISLILLQILLLIKFRFINSFLFKYV